MSKLVNFNSKKFSVKFFKQRLPFIYILFNYLYKRLIVNKNVSKTISKFHKSGYAKLGLNLKNIVDEFNDKFILTQINSKQYKLVLHDLDKIKFIAQVKNELKPVLDELGKYFNSEVQVVDIRLTRNLHHESKDNLKIEYYSNHFHQDSYLLTYNKIFVNLMDITEQDGPLEIIPNENKKLFIKSFNYKDRDNYNTKGDSNLIYKNTGKKGECFLFSSSRLFHRAGVPKNFRDNMSVIIVTLPKYKHKDLNIHNESDLMDNTNKFYHKFTKPYSILNVVRLFIEFYIYKFKKVSE
ncbi:phytanoyl-CoA dioxygenase family protein [Candidatus Pelagibacter bacterium]|nr:phytanoyl-CoA dioxygenase family protein [Candidatus Pelagibacter bacterium]